MPVEFINLTVYYRHQYNLNHTRRVSTERADHLFPSTSVYSRLQSSAYTDLCVVQKPDETVEYVEQTIDRYVVHQEIPKEWCLRILGAESIDCD